MLAGISHALVKNLWFIAALLFTPYANSQPVDLDRLVGTLGVEFQPIQISGLQTGCTLVFKTIVRDHAYRKGELVALAGNISFQSFGSNIILGLKVGLADNFLVQGATTKATPPFFAYMQTPHGTTAKSKVIQSETDPGYRLFAYPFDDKSMEVLADITNGKIITIGFNRAKGGIDVLAPLDLGVAETTATNTGFDRRRSDVMRSLFSKCVEEIISEVRLKLKAQ